MREADHRRRTRRTRAVPGRRRVRRRTPRPATRRCSRRLERQWQHMVATKTYLTGGVGSRWDGEAFGDPYELPPTSPTARPARRSAASSGVGGMLLTTGEAQYADLIERTLFNAFLPGSRFAARVLLRERAAVAHGRRQGRQPQPGVRPAAVVPRACCPPNMMRTLSPRQLPGHHRHRGIVLHQYAAGPSAAGGGAVTVEHRLPVGRPVEVHGRRETAGRVDAVAACPALVRRRELIDATARHPTSPAGLCLRLARDGAGRPGRARPADAAAADAVQTSGSTRCAARSRSSAARSSTASSRPTSPPAPPSTTSLHRRRAAQQEIRPRPDLLGGVTSSSLRPDARRRHPLPGRPDEFTAPVPYRVPISPGRTARSGRCGSGCPQPRGSGR